MKSTYLSIFLVGITLAAAAGWTNYAPLNSTIYLPGAGETLAGLGLLLLWGSLTMALAYTSLREGRTMSSIRMLLLTLILGGAFIEITGAEWYGLWSKGFTTSSGLPGSTFYLMSGVSAAHIFAGLVILSYLLKKTIDGKFNRDNYSSVHYFGIFWGFIVLVWLFMFPLLYLT